MATELNNEHLTAPQIEQLATDVNALHVLQCKRCANAVLEYSAVLQNTPLSEYPLTD